MSDRDVKLQEDEERKDVHEEGGDDEVREGPFYTTHWWRLELPPPSSNSE